MDIQVSAIMHLSERNPNCSMHQPAVTESIKGSDGAPLPPDVPTHPLLPIPGLRAHDEVTQPDILFADSEESYLATGPSPLYINTQPSYCPPEALLTMPALSSPPIGKATDLWTLSCTLGETLSEQSLLGSPPSTPTPMPS
ncbi:MAG: hypothetical protein LQ337_005655 [Flavoplaca oasis]|nr:MAG: hypothetical protein LQ337_005655 [Flavoplaca oasis]